MSGSSHKWTVFCVLLFQVHLKPKYTILHKHSQRHETNKQKLCYLLSPLLIEQLDAAGQRLDGFFETTWTDNVLQILQHPLIMLRLTFRLHHGNLLHLTLDTVHKRTLAKAHTNLMKLQYQSK